MPAPAVLAVLLAMLALAAPLAQAATRYWDGGSVDITANGDGASQGVSGTWNTTLLNWDQGSGLPHVAWVNGSNTAEINGGSQSLTLAANIILGGITQKAGANGAAISGGSGPFTLTLNTTGANTFLAAANSTTGRTLTVNAVIAGGVGQNLVLAGPGTSGIGTINLGSANTFSGSTSFSAGATGGVHVILKHQLAFQNTAVTLSPDVNLIFDSSVSANAFTFGGLDADSNGPGYDLALQNNSGATPIILTLGGNNYDSSYAGVLSGGGSLIKTGSGTLILAGANTYTGSTVINGGTLQVDGILSSPVTVINGVTLAGGGLVNAAVTVAAGGSVNAPVQMTVASPWAVAPGRTATFNGIISGFPGLTVNGGGTVQLNATNTYSGDTTVSSGTLVVNANSALGTGLLILIGGNLSNTASCTLGNGVNLSSNATVSVGASQMLTLSGSLAGTGSLTKSGTGTLALSGANTCTGTTIVSAGTLALGNPAALLATTNLTLGDTTLLQPTVDRVIVKAPVTVGNSGTTATISAPVNSPGAGVVSTLTLNGAISGGGNVTFSSSVNQNALSTVYLGAQSTYSGSTLLDTAGTSDTQIIVKLGTNNALPTNTVLTIDGQTGAGTGRYAELNLNGFNQQFAGLTNIARSLRFQRVVNSDVSAAATLTINNSSDFTFSGILGGSASGSVAAAAMPGSTNGNNFGLIKSGAGTFTLTGQNTYTGTTTVNGGTLELGASNVLATATAVFIGNATLNAATYTCTLGTLDVTGSATINLGAGAALAFADSSAIDWTGGTLNLTGTFVPGASLRFGTNSSGLTAAQLARITAPGFSSFALNASGYLTASAATTFSTWINGTFTGGATVPPDKRGPNDDPSNDGISNLLKYAVAGQDPMVPNPSVGTFSANTLSFTKRPGTSGLTYAIQGSTDLGVTDPWAEVTGASYVNNATTISYTFTPGTHAKYFLRLLILQN